MRIVLAAIGLSALLAGPASAAANHDLRGVWTAGGSGGGQTGDLTITKMNMATGAFSGTSFGGSLTVKGRETGSAVTFTQTTGSYVSTDKGHVSANGMKMSGTWHDTNGHGGTWFANRQSGGGKSSPRQSFTSVSCTIVPSAPSTSSCTATVGDAGPPPRMSPTGTVTFSTTSGTLVGNACSLRATAGSPGVSSCSVAYTPAPGTPPGALPVSASYGGDARLDASTGGTGPAPGVLGVSSVTAAANLVPVPIANPNPAGMTLTLSLAGATASAARAKTVHVKAFGVKVVRLALTKAQRAKLRRKGRLKVSLRVRGKLHGRAVRAKTYRLTVRARHHGR